MRILTFRKHEVANARNAIDPVSHEPALAERHSLIPDTGHAPATNAQTSFGWTISMSEQSGHRDRCFASGT